MFGGNSYVTQPNLMTGPNDSTNSLSQYSNQCSSNLALH